MKCEKCDKEATFHFQSNINGEKTETHLCEDCAKAEGLEKLFVRPRAMMGSFFREPFGGLMGSFFTEPFGMLTENFFGRGFFTPTLGVPTESARTEDRFAETEKSTETEQVRSDNIPEDAGEEIRRKRELLLLREQLWSAVKAEEFEKAAEMRDKIRELEK